MSPAELSPSLPPAADAAPPRPAASPARRGPADLRPLFAPAAVAIVGVSSDPRKLGNQVCRNVIAGGYAGTILPVGSAAEFEGLPVAPDLESLPVAPDLVFLAVPAAATPAAARQAAARGARAIIVGASGFAETGPEGEKLQRELTEVAAETGVRIVGPNCNGIYSARARLSLGFNTAHGEPRVAGGIALLSHSGALYEAMVRRAEAMGGGLSMFVSVGNEADLSMLDHLEHAIADPDTRTIALLIDSVADGRRLRALAARSADAGKPIVALRIGRTKHGALVAEAHSSRMAQDPAADAALLAGAGIAEVTSVESLMIASILLSRFGKRTGGLAGLSTSGAGASLIADLAEAHNVRLAEYGEATRTALEARRKFSQLRNPTDLGYFGTLAVLGEAVAAITADPDTGAFLALVHALGRERAAILGQAWASAASGTPIIVLAPGGLPQSEREAHESAGAIVLTESAAGFEALGALLGRLPDNSSAPARHKAGLELDPSLPAGPLGEAEGLDLLRRAGIATVECVRCDGAEEACEAAARVGWPVVLKGVLDGVIHKTERGLVAVGLLDEAALRETHARMGCQRTLVQAMVDGPLELFVGFTDSASSGPLLVAGLGGIFAEAHDGRLLWSLPVVAGTLRRDLSASAIGRIFASGRWKEPAAMDDLVDILLRLQALALANEGRLQAFDVNPIIFGDGPPRAVDAAAILGEHQ